MIKSLRVQNFESHEDNLLEFSPGLNVFIGESDRGKSGIFRAYKLLIQNKPGGDWMFPLFWDGTSIITGEFIEPEFTVKRIKGKSENSYILNEDNPINAGTSVPNNIATLLNLDDVNLQTQVDRAFLMFETAGERGRILNRFAGLDEIESTLDNAKKDVDKLTGLWKTEKATLKTKEKELKEFIDIEEMERRVSLIDNMQKLLIQSGSRVNILKKLSGSIKTLDDAITEKEGLLAAESILEDLKARQQEVTAVQKRITKLRGLENDLGEVEGDLQGENYEDIEPIFQRIKEASVELRKYEDRVKKLKRFSSAFRIIEADIQVAEDELKDLQAKIPNICSECGAELKR